MINLNNNDYFYKYSTNDLKLLKKFILEYEIEYRSKLNINPKYTFGFELEVDDFDYKDFWGTKQTSIDGYSYKFESTIPDGAEFVSPILTDNDITWINLDLVCKKLSDISKISELCGGHIHFGSQVFNSMISINNFIRIWLNFENIFFRYGYGEYLNERPVLNRFATPLNKLDLEDDYTSLNDLKYNFIDRFSAINFKRIKSFNYDENNTIEFRFCNGSLNPIILQNRVLTFIKLMELSNRCSSFNDLFYDKDIMSNIDYYKDIYLKQALYISDLLFNNNQDKLDFLKIYFKDFKVSHSPLFLEDSKVFIKK